MFLLDTNVVSELRKFNAGRAAMIAATALEQGLVVVTRNIQDFERMGVELLNPWL